MKDYLNPAGIYPDGIKPMEYKSVEPANQCVSCGAEMPEGDMVCPACISTTQESLQVEEKVRKSAEIMREGADRIRNLMGLKIWLIEQIEQETDETRLKTLKRMLEGEGV